jgi:hypothetical protein
MFSEPESHQNDLTENEAEKMLMDSYESILITGKKGNAAKRKMKEPKKI